jgi:hypothetical protein
MLSKSSSVLGWECDSEVEHLLSICGDLSSSPALQKKKGRKTKKKEEEKC